MPPKKNKTGNESIIVVFDIGQSLSKENSAVPFFLKAKDCLSLILQRKIFSESQDRVGLLLLGAEDSAGRNIISGFKYLSCPFELQPVTWDILSYVMNDVKPAENATNWIDGLTIAIEMLSLSEDEVKRVVLISEFSSSVSKQKFNDVLKPLKELEISVIVIGPDHFSDIILDRCGEPSTKKSKGRSEDEKASATLIQEMWDFLETSLQVSTFDSALRQLSIQPVAPVRRTPWNAILDIGDIEISVTALVKVKTRQPPTKTRKVQDLESVTDSSNISSAGTSAGNDSNALEEIARGKEMYYTSKDSGGGDGSVVPVAQEEIIMGHKYGDTIVPLGDADAEAFKFLPGAKGISVLGFTSASRVNLGIIIGEDSRVIVPRENDTDSEVALSALIQAMVQKNARGVARKVYAHDRGLSLVLLTPIVEEILDESEKILYKECLVMSELPYKEGIKHVEFPSLNASMTSEQSKLIDELIDSMDLMKADIGPDGEPCEAFEISTLREFKNQFYQHCIVQRAVYPEKPLPTDLPLRLKESYSLPRSLRIKNKSVAEKIKNVFPLTFVPQKTKFRKSNNEDAEKLENGAAVITAEEREKEEVPQDFPKPIIADDDEICVQNIKSLFHEYCLPPPRALIWEVMISSTSDTVKKETVFEALAACISERRVFCATRCPRSFNEWMRELKENTLDYKEFRDYMLKDIAVKFGLVSKSENAASDVSLEDAKKFASEEEAPILITSQDFHLPFPDTVEMRLQAEREELLNDIF